jgi:Uncharacterized protein conserved in bacteria
MDRLERSLLLDFYGELLTEKQRECCDLYYNEDLSLSEIAEQRGISRQGVWDNIRHAESAMEEYEEKTGIVRRFSRTREELEKIQKLLGGLEPSDASAEISSIIETLIEGA